MLAAIAKHRSAVVGASKWPAWIGLALSVGVAYFLAARGGLVLLTTAEPVAVFWPASGIAIGMLVAFGPWARAPVAVGVIAATFAASLTVDRSLFSALAFGLCNAGEALLVMWLIARWPGPGFSLDSLRGVLGFFAAVTVASAAAATVASAAMLLFGPPGANFVEVWKVWFAADMLGAVTVAPLLIGAVAAARDLPPWPEFVEGSLAVLVTAVTSGFALALLAGSSSLIEPASFLFPLLLWLGARCRPVFAAAAVFTIAAGIVFTTIHEFGRYGDPSIALADRVFAAQVAMLGTTLAALALAAIFAERRRHQAALAESDSRLRSSLDAANVIAWDVDLPRNKVHSAGPVRRLLDLRERPLPQDFAAMIETIHPLDRDRVMAQFWQAVGTAATYRLEFRLNVASEVRWVTAEGSIERDEDGRPTRVRGITHDITERKHAELALAERDAQLQLAEKAARVGSFAIDIASGNVQISPGYATIHGLAESTVEFLRVDWRTRVQVDDLARLDALRSQAFAERRSEHNTEYRIALPDGKTRWIESRGLLFYADDGRPSRIIGVNIDVTERKYAAAALEESEARYRALYDDNPSMYFTVDAGGTVLSVNEFGARQLGYAPAELVGHSVLQVIHPEDRQSALRHLARCAAAPETVFTSELRKIHRDGSIMWVREVARAVRDSGLLIVCEEITERKRAEEQQSLLIAELDHRVKNVLASVAAIARRTGERKGSMEDFVATLDRRIQSMADAHDLLSRNRWQGVSLAELVKRELAPYAGDGNWLVEGPDIVLAAAATQAAAMVLHELATNAAKYGALSTPQGQVCVRWQRLSPAGAPTQLRLEWLERGGPKVVRPAEAGYGTSVIRDLIPYELGGAVELDFSPSGVNCIIEFTLETEVVRLVNPSADLDVLRTLGAAEAATEGGKLA
ncbi:MAG TPA: PAS domain-containing protein [Hyphomicrobiaceae bacterium]|nr:PAS domain-containing protein [Hyphomicrobiaceae bacterium]